MKKMLFLLSLIACNAPGDGRPEPVPGEPFQVATAEDSARTNGPFMRIHPMGQFPEMIQDNIDRQPSLQIEQWLSTPVTQADFGRILKSGQAMEMVAFGGGLTAGVMNGGITRESQQVNYTNLLAHQMGIKNFEMPLFDKEHFNGTGYYVYRYTESGYPQWDRVVNNTISLLPGDPLRMPEYTGKISNYALANGGAEWLDRSYACENCELTKLGLTRFSRYVPPYPSEAFNGSLQLTGRITDHSINKVLKEGQKGVIFTVPRYQDLPYMNWYSGQELSKRGSGIYITFDRNGNRDQIIDASRPFSMIPSARLHQLFEF